MIILYKCLGSQFLVRYIITERIYYFQFREKVLRFNINSFFEFSTLVDKYNSISEL